MMSPTQASALLPLVAVAGSLFLGTTPAGAQWSASDVVSIDRVERSVFARYKTTGDSDATSGTSVATWNGSAKANGTSGSLATRIYASADQSFTVDADGISGIMENEIKHPRRGFTPPVMPLIARSRSKLEVEFEIFGREDYSLPDSTWGFSGSSPLERLLMDSRGIGVDEAPIIRVSLSSSILTSHKIDKMPFGKFKPLDSSFISGSRRIGAVGARLWRVDEYGAVEELEFNAVTTGAVSTRELNHDFDVELAPGRYILQVQSGLETIYTTGKSFSVEVDLDLAFEYTGPGAIESSIGTFNRELYVAANGSTDSWSTSDPLDDDWEWAKVGSASTMAQAGSVAVFEPAGWHGYLHARSKHPATTASGPSESANELEVEFTLAQTTDVGVALLLDFWQRSSSANVNWDWCDLEIRDASTGIQKLWMAHGGLGTTSFDEDEAWVSLPAGTYELSISVGCTSWDQTIAAGEDETAVWFALLFE